jgi:hypothetical protein
MSPFRAVTSPKGDGGDRYLSNILNFWRELKLRKLHNEELHNLYSSPNIIRMIKSRKIRWAGHAARMGEPRNPYRILVGMPE